MNQTAKKLLRHRAALQRWLKVGAGTMRFTGGWPMRSSPIPKRLEACATVMQLQHERIQALENQLAEAHALAVEQTFSARSCSPGLQVVDAAELLEVLSPSRSR